MAAIQASIRKTPAYQSGTTLRKARMDAILSLISGIGGLHDARAFRRILGSPFWRTADEASRGALLMVFERLALSGQPGGHGCRHASIALAQMSDRMLEGAPLLLSKASDANTLADRLFLLATRLRAEAPELRAAGLIPRQILAELVLDINDPGRIRQSVANTCTAATVAFVLAEQEPAEYARVATELLTTGRVRMQGGGELERQADFIVPLPHDSRSLSTRVVQSAIMEFGSPHDYQPRDGKDVQVGSVMGTLPPVAAAASWIAVVPGIVLSMIPFSTIGLTSHDEERAARELFGQRWLVRMSHIEGLAHLAAIWSAESQVEWLLERQPTGDLVGDRVLASLWWDSAYHRVKIEHVDPPEIDPRMVTVRNPHASDIGARRDDPVAGAPAGSVWVNPQRGTIAIPLPEFKTRLSTDFRGADHRHLG
jgi:hypothetical protein